MNVGLATNPGLAWGQGDIITITIAVLISAFITCVTAAGSLIKPR